MKKNSSITVMIPAYNEEKYLKSTVLMVMSIAKKIFKKFEIIIFNDCSKDRTKEIADKLAKSSKYIWTIHNKRNRGLGYNYRTGVKLAKYDYYCSLMADIDTTYESIERIFSQVGNRDIVLSYIKDDDRPIYRRIISGGFTILLNLFFGHKIKYYCGIIIMKTSDMRKVRMRTNSFAMNAEVIIQLITKRKTYVQIPYESTDHGRVDESNIFRLGNFIGAFKTIFILLNDVYLRNLLK